MSEVSKTLEEQLEDSDWALIISKDGSLKGLFMPDGADEDLVPESIIYIMEKYFGIDFSDDIDLDYGEETSDGKTLH